MSVAESVTATFNLAVTEYKLKVIKAGSGTGTVTSSPAGIDCGATCEASYKEGTKVTLTEKAETGSTFAGWSGGGCSGTASTCEVTMSVAESVTATFNLAVTEYKLKVIKAGSGTGTVTSSPAGIDCGATCEASYKEGTKVTLTEKAETGSTFAGWSGGGCSGTASTCEVTMSVAESVTATFNLAVTEYKLKVIKAGSGTGTVTSSPAGIDCGATCEASYKEGTKVTLTEKAETGSTFAGWSGGGCSGTASTCEVTMSVAESVTATFNLAVTEYKLKVIKAGSGTGTVTSSPAGIDCGATCEASYKEGTKVTLTEKAETGSTFAGWSGGGCSGTASTCEVTMSVAESVTATFNLAVTEYKLKVIKAGSGTGTVTSSPAGIDCGATCEASYKEGTKVTLTEKAETGSTFAGWSGGGCSGTASTCEVTMSVAESVTATFNLAVTEYKLKVIKAGSGTGTVTSSPAGIDCGATCEASYKEGTKVTLTEKAETGSTFAGWSGGGCSGTASTCEVTMSVAESVTATFNLAVTEYKLKVIKAGSGTGTVTSSPAGIDCGATCEASYKEGTKVTLTEKAETGSTFAGWSGGGCSGTASTCEVTMSVAESVTATFNLAVTEYKLKVIKAGSGTGTVTRYPAGIDCGATCEASYKEGTKVTLTEKAETGSTFAGWSGGGCSGTASTCEVTMSVAESVTATFNLAVTEYKLKVIKAGS